MRKRTTDGQPSDDRRLLSGLISDLVKYMADRINMPNRMVACKNCKALLLQGGRYCPYCFNNIIEDVPWFWTDGGKVFYSKKNRDKYKRLTDEANKIIDLKLGQEAI